MSDSSSSQRRILLIGANGQLGRALAPALAHSGVVVTGGRRAGLDVAVDLEKPRTVRRAVSLVRPAIVVNAAAYTGVDAAEHDVERCDAVNARGVGVLAQACARSRAALVHVSTDYVFSGTKGKPYRETDPAVSRNVYGRTKRRGETRALAAGGPCLILRTGWLYSLRGPSFVTTMARLLREREKVRVVDDQVGGPTWTQDLAAAMVHILGLWRPREPSAARGLLHVSGGGQATWREFAAEIGRIMGASCEIEPTTTDAWDAPAPRPRYSVLDTRLLYGTFGVRLPYWQDALARCLRQLRTHAAESAQGRRSRVAGTAP